LSVRGFSDELRRAGHALFYRLVAFFFTLRVGVEPLFLALIELNERTGIAPHDHFSHFTIAKLQCYRDSDKLTRGSAFSLSATSKNSLGLKPNNPASMFEGNTCCFVLYCVTRSL
jgi:hypothetical protein